MHSSVRDAFDAFHHTAQAPDDHAFGSSARQSVSEDPRQGDIGDERAAEDIRILFPPGLGCGDVFGRQALHLAFGDTVETLGTAMSTSAQLAHPGRLRAWQTNLPIHRHADKAPCKLRDLHPDLWD